MRDEFVCTKCHRLLRHSWIKHIGCLIHGHKWHGLGAYKKLMVRGRVLDYEQLHERMGCVLCGAQGWESTEGRCGVTSA